MMGQFIFFVFALLSLSKAFSEELGPLPPIGISLYAPIQIDDSNKQAQDAVLKTIPKEVQDTLMYKRFPIELMFLLLFLLALKVFWKKRKPPVEVVVLPIITASERLDEAEKILAEASETLSEEQSLALFRTLDPIAVSLPEPEKYRAISDRVKFAGFTLKKSDFIRIK